MAELRLKSSDMRLPRPHRIRAPTRRIFSVTALALLFLVAQLGNLIHHTAVQHVTCAEHGKQIHVDVDHARADDALAAFTIEVRHPLGPIALGSPFAPHSDDHDHCGICATTRELETDSAVLASVVADIGSSAEVIARADRLIVDEHGYRLAPKTSPPA